MSMGVMTDPTSLAEYEQAVPGCGKDILQRFFDRTEQEQQHRHKLDRDVFEAERLHAERLMKQGDRSQWMALVIALAGFAIVAYALYLDHPWVAGVVATFDIGGLASMFMYGRKKQAESYEKRELLKGSG